MTISRFVIVSICFSAASFAAASVRYDAGLQLYKAGDCAGALREFAASELADEQASERPYYEGVCLVKQSQWTKAQTKLAPFAKEHAADARGWYWLAQAQLYDKRFGDAKESITRSLAVDAKQADSLRTLGEIELELKNYDGAYRAWIGANKLDPGDVKTTYYLGRLFFEAEFFNEAASWFRETLKLDPQHYAAMTYLGLAAERLNMESTALDLYKAAIRISKKQGKPYAWAYVSLGKLLRQMGNENEAMAVLEESEKTCPDAHGLTVLGQMLAGANQSARAEAVLRRAVEMDSTIPDAHYRLALLLRSSHPEEAQAEMRKFQETKVAEEKNKPKIQAIRKSG